MNSAGPTWKRNGARKLGGAGVVDKETKSFRVRKRSGARVPWKRESESFLRHNYTRYGESAAVLHFVPAVACRPFYSAPFVRPIASRRQHDSFCFCGGIS